MRPAVRALLLALLAPCLPAPGALAQWSGSASVNNAVCIAPEEQFFVVAVPDGTGGMIIAWEDFREDSIGDIYAQRMSADGVPLWAAGGIPVITAVSPQLPQLVSDGEGGAILFYMETQELPAPRIMAQRISGDGRLRWIGAGIAVCSAHTIASLPVVIPDGSGGAYVAWTDNRAEGWNGTDIEAQHIDRNGRLFWQPDGLPVCQSRGNQNRPALALASDKRLVIAWQDDRAYTPGTAYDVYAQRVTPGGAMTWAANGIAVAEDAGLDAAPAAVADAAGGALFLWMSPRPDGAGSDLHAQRVDAGGTRLWGAGGEAITDLATPKGGHRAIPDGSGGFIAAWHDQRTFARLHDVVAQRADADGHVAWAPDGVALCGAAGQQYLHGLIADGAGGAVAVWEDTRLGLDSDIYAARVTAGGAMPWPSDGLAVSRGPGDQEYPLLLESGDGGELLAWVDRRSGEADVYAARIRPDGALGASYVADHFTFERADGAVLDSLVAGDTIAIRVTARTVSGFVADEFEGQAEITSDGLLDAGGGVTVPFVDGLLATHPLAFRRSGRYHLFASAAPGEATGATPVLLVRPPTPRAFSAAASDLQERAVRLEWTPAAAGEAAEYHVFRSTEAIYDTTTFRVLTVDPVAGAVTDTVPAFGAWHYLLVAEDPAGIVSHATPERVTTASPLCFEIGTAIFQNHGATRHLAVVVAAESLLAAPPAVSLHDGGAPPGEAVTLAAIPGDSAVFAGAIDLPDEGTHVLRTRALAPDGRRADRLRSFNAAVTWPGESLRLAVPEGGIAVDLAPGAAPAGSWLLAMMEGEGTARFGPALELGAGARIEWEAEPGEFRIEIREHGAWAPLATSRTARGDAVCAGITRLGEFRLVRASGGPGTGPGDAAPLLAIRPNPCRGGARIAWSLASPARIDLAIHDAAGRRVRTLASGDQPAGTRELAWDGRDGAGRRMAPGIYFVTLREVARASTRKLILLD